MTRVQEITLEKAPKKVQEVYSLIEKNMGRLPNIFLNMGNSLPVLTAYLSLNDALNQTSLNPRLREKIALAIAESNHCDYCLSAHTALAHNEGITDQEILKARTGQSSDPKVQAILSFIKSVVEKRGNLSEQEISNLKAKGVNDAEIVELILAITVNLFTNYFNLVTGPKIDFPLAPKLAQK